MDVLKKEEKKETLEYSGGRYKKTTSDAVNVRKENCKQLPAPAADELTPFAASVSPSVRRRASSVRRGQPEAALAG